MQRDPSRDLHARLWMDERTGIYRYGRGGVTQMNGEAFVTREKKLYEWPPPPAGDLDITRRGPTESESRKSEPLTYAKRIRNAFISAYER